MKWIEVDRNYNYVAALGFNIMGGRHKQQQLAIVSPVDGLNESSIGEADAAIDEVTINTNGVTPLLIEYGINTERVWANINSAGTIFMAQ
jgi:hypothetical protein